MRKKNQGSIYIKNIWEESFVRKEIIKKLKFMLVVFTAPLKGNLRISFYQVKFMLPCGSGRKNSGARSLNLERG